MDKPSERKKDNKEWGDTDVGIQDYGAGGKREQLPNMWAFPTILSGSREQRLVNQNYCKESHAAYDKNKGNPNHTIGEVLNSLETSGTAKENTSQPWVVTKW